MSIRLSVAIVTWNQRETLRKCLESVQAAINLSRDEIVVVDNGSVDGTDEMLRVSFPSVRYLRLPRNIGVAPARNRALALCSGEYVAVLDDDTRILDRFFADEIERIFQTERDVGLFSFRLQNPDGTIQRNVRRFPTLIQPVLARIAPLNRIPPLRKLLAQHMMLDVDLENVEHVLNVDYVLGANQVFRRDYAAKAGGYDDHMFCGPDDIDLCLKIRRLGLRVCFVPTCRIEHAYQRRTKGFTWRTVLHIYYFYYFFLRTRSVWVIRP